MKLLFGMRWPTRAGLDGPPRFLFAGEARQGFRTKATEGARQSSVSLQVCPFPVPCTKIVKSGFIGGLLVFARPG